MVKPFIQAICAGYIREVTGQSKKYKCDETKFMHYNSFCRINTDRVSGNLCIGYSMEIQNSENLIQANRQLITKDLGHFWLCYIRITPTKSRDTFK